MVRINSSGRESMELLKYIRLGIQSRDFFLYDDQTITLRPLCTQELDDASEAALDIATPSLVQFLIQVKLNKIDLFDEKSKPILDTLYTEIRAYYDRLDYYIVYHGMKDFLSEDFSVKDVKLMHDIHKIADKIMAMSNADRDLVDEVITTPEGKKLADIIYVFHVPITDAAWKLTPLQIDFLSLSHPDAPKNVAKDWADFCKKKEEGDIP